MTPKEEKKTKWSIKAFTWGYTRSDCFLHYTQQWDSLNNQAASSSPLSWGGGKLSIDNWP